MNAGISVTQRQLSDVLLAIAPVRPVFIWGPPGIGKSSLVQRFAADVGLPCVSLLGSQLAPEDLLGVPQIVDGTTRFCPPRTIARAEPYCLFLDELNACSHEVQKSFYSLIHERRVGEYELPAGSVVVGAGNRGQDSAIVKPMSSALLNRMVHVHLSVSHRDWLDWAGGNAIHPWVTEYVRLRPDQLWTRPPKHEEPFSTPRSWHMLSDALHEYGDDVGETVLEVLAFGCLSPVHAGQFKTFVKQMRSSHRLSAILDGRAPWPHEPADRDVLYFLSQSFPGAAREGAAGRPRRRHRPQPATGPQGEGVDLVAGGDQPGDGPDGRRADNGHGDALPTWLLVEVVRDLPRLVERKEKKA